MSATSEAEPKIALSRGRKARAEEEAPRRRRRLSNDNTTVLRLGVPEEKLDRAHFAYRWSNDTPGRIPQLYSQDWDPVSDEELGADYKAERFADISPNRAPLTTRLMRKPLDLYNEDHAAKQQALDAEMQAAQLGQKVLNGPTADGSQGLQAGQATVYVPNPEANKL